MERGEVGGDLRDLSLILAESSRRASSTSTTVPRAIFTAAKDAEKVVEYTIGLERQATAMREHAEWVAEYAAHPAR